MAQRPGRRTVRANQLERHLDRVMSEYDMMMAARMSDALGQYHIRQVEPRLRWIERPWWLKLWHALRRYDFAEFKATYLEGALPTLDSVTPMKQYMEEPDPAEESEES